MNASTTATPTLPVTAGFFQGGDWMAFGLTTGFVWIIYLFSLSPDLDLEYSGVLATSALYPGVAEPPGHPLWAIFGWLVIHIFPFGNIAWRLSVAAALAGALTSGLVAVIVSSVGRHSLKVMMPGKACPFLWLTLLRLISAGVAGLALGLDACVWRQAVVPESWTLELLLLALTVTLLTCWIFVPQRRRYLCFAALMCGLSLTESQANVPVIFGVPCLVVVASRPLGRDLFFLLALLLGTLYALSNNHFWRNSITDILGGFSVALVWMLAFCLLIFPGLAIRTRGVFSEWKASVLFATLVMIGLSPYLLLPLYSLSGPPLDWGYPRTVEGFLHVVSRGQFETLQSAHDPRQFFRQLDLYFHSICDDLGLIYVLISALPLVAFFKWPSTVRGWLAGLLAFGLLLGLFTVLGVSPDLSRSSTTVDKFSYAATHFVIAIFTGCGLILIGTWFISERFSAHPPQSGTSSLAPPNAR